MLGEMAPQVIPPLHNRTHHENITGIQDNFWLYPVIAFEEFLEFDRLLPRLRKELWRKVARYVVRMMPVDNA